MLSVQEALDAVLRTAIPLPPARRALASCRRRVLAEPIVSDTDLPPFDKALVDGFAVRAGELSGEPPHVLTVSQEIFAGGPPPRPLHVGEAAAIMTGAPLPENADAVVMIEQTSRDGQGRVVLDGTVRTGMNRLVKGRELRAGETILEPAAVLNAPALGVLAAVGRSDALVHPAPRVAVVVTGDELVPPGEPLGPGQIRETNSLVLRALIDAAGAEPAEPGPIARDEPEPLAEALHAQLRNVDSPPDVLLVCGGVSAGKKDLVPAALERLGVERVFHRVRVKPGKPLWFGHLTDRTTGRRTLVFGLPGNPVAVVVCFLLFVEPALRRLAPGLSTGLARPGEGRLATPFRHHGDRPTYHPSTIGLDGLVTPLDWAGSADLRGIMAADGFARFPEGDRLHEAGETVEFLRVSW